MEKFTQLLQPVADNLYISALVALIPIVFYLVALAGFKVKGWLTGLLTLIVAIVVAVVFLKCHSNSQQCQLFTVWFMDYFQFLGLF